MISLHRLLLALLLLGSLSSCIISRKFNSIQFEVLTPSEITLPENIKTVALINRDLHCKDTSLASYNYMNNWYKMDTIKNLKLTNECIYSLAKILQKDGKFEQIVNYYDTTLQTRQLLKNGNQNDTYDSIKTDLCIFFDSLRFSGIPLSGYPNLYRTKVSLNWSYTYRSDSAYHTFHRNDSIVYDDVTRMISFRGIKMYQIGYLNLSCKDIGNLMGTLIKPTWNSVQQIYYHSKNPDMLKAEKFIRQREWLKAAEILNEKTKSKNIKLAAKACYNMAVVNEMEGHPDIAIEWLNKTDSGKGSFMKEYKTVCKQYIKVLTLRKKEIETLDKQVRKQDEN